MRLPINAGSLRAGRHGQDRALEGGALHKRPDNTGHSRKRIPALVDALSGMRYKRLKWQKPNRYSKE